MAGQNVQFGSGVVTITPNAGDLAANPTPIRLKILQEASIEFKSDLKKLFGQKQFAVATARGKIDVTGKMKVAAYDANDINQIYWGQQVVSGGARPVVDELHAVAASVTPTVGAGLLVVADSGVIDVSTGKNLTRVPSAPEEGEYSFTPATSGGSPTAAAYVFNASETIAKVLLSYTSTSTLGSSLAMENQVMGTAPVCSLLLVNKFRGNMLALQLNAVTLGTLSFPTKQEDFWVSDVDFSANCDDSDVLGVLYAD